MKTTTITRALLSDRETERPAQPQSRPCFACGRSFLYRRAVGDNSGRFCSCSMTSTKRPRAKPGPGNCQVCRSEHLHAINWPSRSGTLAWTKRDGSIVLWTSGYVT
jgi:hypothetical protein